MKIAEKKLQEIKDKFKTVFEDIDFYFAEKILELNGQADVNNELFMLVMLLSYSVSKERHTCLNLSDVKQLKDYFASILIQNDELDSCRPIIDDFSDNLLTQLEDCFIVGKPGDYQPLILDKKRLYLHKYWVREKNITDKLRLISKIKENYIDINLLKERLNKLFPISPIPDNKTDWQRVAAYTSVINKFSVITGGPGTGKTTVVATVLALLQEQSIKCNGHSLDIRLCAPTGKASARLSESVSREKDRMKFDPHMLKLIPEESTTIHRLLGSKFLSPNFKYDSERKLNIDVVVIDEASMVPMMLMSRLLDAVPDSTKVILLGDKDQLVSVEAGAVFGDICEFAGFGNDCQNLFSENYINEYLKTEDRNINIYKTENENLLIDCVVELTESHRFAEDKGIGKLKKAVNKGESDLAFDIINNANQKELSFWEMNNNPKILYDHLKDMIMNLSVTEKKVPYLSYIKYTNLHEVFEIFNCFRVLCANKIGMWGSQEVNRHITEIIKKHYNIPRNILYFKGMPIMIKSNYYPLNLFNGDIGLCWCKDDAPENIGVYFPDLKNPGQYRRFSPAQLPSHETVFAMTIHKSQGSDFENVLLLLSGGDKSELLTRELVYTGITRAKKNVEIWSSETVFKDALSRITVRNSGINDKLAT